MNYYEVLEVAPDAPQNEIHRAYQRAKTTYSQDNPALYSMFSRDEARELLRMVEEAYAILGNHALRKSYDDTLLKAGLHSMAMSAPFGKAAPISIASPSSPEPDHAALPDFMVPDPSIPGSTDHHQFDTPPLSVVPALSSPTAATPSQASSLNSDLSGASAMDAAFRREEHFESAAAEATGSPRQQESVMVAGDDFTVRRREAAAPTAVPAGHVKLPLATYKVDAEMEAKIAQQTVYDGPFLKMVREYRGIPMDKLSETSRIGKTYLLAIEGNDMRSLPAPVFLRGFLVQIAKHLGLDEKLVVGSYLSMVKDQSKK